MQNYGCKWQNITCYNISTFPKNTQYCPFHIVASEIAKLYLHFVKICIRLVSSERDK